MLSMHLSGDEKELWEGLDNSDEEDSDDERSRWDAIFSDFKRNDFKDVPLKYDPEFRKYFRMLQSGLSKNAVRQIMKKDGKENDLCVLEFDPNVPLDRKKKAQHWRCSSELPLRNDPEYSKYFAMLARGECFPNLKQLALKDGKDPEVLELDPSRSLASQMGTLKKKKKKSNGRPNKEQLLLKDDPRYSQYFEMLRAGTSVQLVKEAMDKDGRATSVLDLDPNLPLETQKLELSGHARATIALNKIRKSLSSSSLPISSSSDLNFAFSIAKHARRRSADYSDDDDSSSAQSIGSISSRASATARANAEVLAKIKKALMEVGEEEDEEEKMQKLAHLSAVMESSSEWNNSLRDAVTLSDDKTTKVLNEELPLKNDPEYFKYFLMLDNGVSSSAVEQLLIKDGKDPEVLKLDPSRTLASQAARTKEEKKKLYDH